VAKFLDGSEHWNVVVLILHVHDVCLVLNDEGRVLERFCVRNLLVDYGSIVRLDARRCQHAC